MPRRALQPEQYTVGWVCALPVELAAAQELLDELHDRLDAARTSAYVLGRVGRHNIVLASLPAGQTGTNSAAAVAIGIQRDFPSIHFGLMVGIGGGVPNADNDIRLGDVVVSQPQSTHGGVIQYDSGKSRPEKFERTGFLMHRQRSQELLSRHRSRLKRLPHFARESAGQDLLYEPAYHHVGGSTCDNCDNCSNEYLVKRPARKSQGTIVHYGTIASGNQVMRDGMSRDRLSSELGGVLCFEMEAAGLMNTFPCLVIRGICDYADLHKDKRWQPHAAIVAAAYAKELLSLVHAPETTLREIYDTNQAKAVKHVLDVNCKNVRVSLDFTQMHHRRLVIRKPYQGTGRWLSQIPQFQAWLRGDCQFLWIKGKAGSGKSTLMKRTLEELQNDHADNSVTIASFFYDASGHMLEHSTIGVLRSVLHQIFSQNHELLVEFMNASDGRFAKGKGMNWKVEELMAMFKISCGLQCWRPTILLLDG
ncbi:hypothetical protein K456DRAFT_547249 [Colletotrichum gloeosporioides 23]|nr:hypothetical protein K456DRAFT_547249 [Colletotrichum gloeosporioides 23]